MEIAPSLLLPSLKRCDLDAVRRWGRQVAWRARDAVQLVDRYRAVIASRNERMNAITSHFGLDREGHCFRAEPHRWLRLTEVQSTQGLATFLNQGGPETIRAFLRALAPQVTWPVGLTELRARVEVPAGAGRIDLLITGKAGRCMWGAVVEAKLEHHSGSNPLRDYATYARESGMLVPERRGNLRTGVLVILAKRNCRRTQARLNRNKRWDLVHWRALLHRLELELTMLRDEAEFRRFRRTLWERVA